MFPTNKIVRLKIIFHCYKLKEKQSKLINSVKY